MGVRRTSRIQVRPKSLQAATTALVTACVQGHKAGQGKRRGTLRSTHSSTIARLQDAFCAVARQAPSPRGASAMQELSGVPRRHTGVVQDDVDKHIGLTLFLDAATSPEDGVAYDASFLALLRNHARGQELTVATSGFLASGFPDLAQEATTAWSPEGGHRPACTHAADLWRLGHYLHALDRERAAAAARADRRRILARVCPYGAWQGRPRPGRKPCREVPPLGDHLIRSQGHGPRKITHRHPGSG